MNLLENVEKGARLASLEDENNGDDGINEINGFDIAALARDETGEWQTVRKPIEATSRICRQASRSNSQRRDGTCHFDVEFIFRVLRGRCGIHEDSRLSRNVSPRP